LEAGGGNAPYDERRLIEKMSREFDAFRRIERFARTIAVLHWIADTNPSGLPPLPKGLQIKRFDIPAQMTKDQVRFVSFSKP
jgi:phage tail protein X